MAYVTELVSPIAEALTKKSALSSQLSALLLFASVTYEPGNKFCQGRGICCHYLELKFSTIFVLWNLNSLNYINIRNYILKFYFGNSYLSLSIKEI